MKTKKTKYLPRPLGDHDQTGIPCSTNNALHGEEGTLCLTLGRDSYGDSVSVNTSLSCLNGIGGLLRTL